jgi:hypothetical protein
MAEILEEYGEEEPDTDADTSLDEIDATDASDDVEEGKKR